MDLYWATIFILDHLGLIVASMVVSSIIIGAVRVCAQYEEAVILRLGKFQRIQRPGLYLLIPLIDRQIKLDLRIQTRAGVRQSGITSDNVAIDVDAVIWYKIKDTKKAAIDVADYAQAVMQVCLTTLRTALGQHTLDEVLKAQDKMAEAMQTEIDKVTETWGIEVTRIQMKDVEIPESMERALAQEAEALREKRARMIKAEAEFDAASKLAEAADVIARNPVSLELRRFQMMTEIGAEQNSSTIIMFPSEFAQAAKHIADLAARPPSAAK